MATNTAYAKLIREGESLQGSCAENKPTLEGIDPVLAQLSASLDNLKALKTRQEQMEGSRQETTQFLQQAAEQVREAIRRVRGFVKSQVGTKSERLPQFGVAPIRSRSARRPTLKQPVQEPPAAKPAE
jgi:hypothetical protein